MEIPRDNKFITQLIVAAQKGKGKGYHYILERFQNSPRENHCSRLDAMEHSAHTVTKLQKKTIHTWLQQKRVKDVNFVGCWYSTAKGKKVP